MRAIDFIKKMAGGERLGGRGGGVSFGILTSERGPSGGVNSDETHGLGHKQQQEEQHQQQQCVVARGCVQWHLCDARLNGGFRDLGVWGFRA